MALRKKEAEEERDKDIGKKRCLLAMYDEDTRLKNEKRDKLKLEENTFDLNWLEDLFKTFNTEERERLLRKVGYTLLLLFTNIIPSQYFRNYLMVSKRS